MYSLLIYSADIDKCEKGTHNCDSNADCINTEVSFECVCRAGWEGNGQACTGIQIMQRRSTVSQCDKSAHRLPWM